MFFVCFILFIAMPELLGSAKLAVEKDQSQGHNESYIKQLSDYIVPALVEALHKVVYLFVSQCLNTFDVYSCFTVVFHYTSLDL